MPRSYLGYVNHQFTSCAWQQASHLDAVTEAVRAYVSQWSTEFESGQLDWTVLPVFVLTTANLTVSIGEFTVLKSVKIWVTDLTCVRI